MGAGDAGYLTVSEIEPWAAMVALNGDLPRGAAPRSTADESAIEDTMCDNFAMLSKLRRTGDLQLVRFVVWTLSKSVMGFEMGIDYLRTAISEQVPTEEKAIITRCAMIGGNDGHGDRALIAAIRGRRCRCCWSVGTENTKLNTRCDAAGGDCRG